MHNLLKSRFGVVNERSVDKTGMKESYLSGNAAQALVIVRNYCFLILACHEWRFNMQEGRGQMGSRMKKRSPFQACSQKEDLFVDHMFASGDCPWYFAKFCTCMLKIAHLFFLKNSLTKKADCGKCKPNCQAPTPLILYSTANWNFAALARTSSNQTTCLFPFSSQYV